MPARLQLPDLPPATLEALLDRTHALVYALGPQEQLLTINRAMRDRIDYEPAAVPDLRTLVRLLYPEPAVREGVVGAHQMALAGRPMRDMEWVLTTRQGDQRQVVWHFLVHGEGDARLLLVLGEDVTDRRKLEHWVRLQNALLERVPEAIIVSDLDGRILHWTGSAEKLLGYPIRSALERPLSNLFPGETSRGLVLGILGELREKGEAEWVRELRKENGEQVECRIRGSRVQNERGQMVAVALVVTPPALPGATEEGVPADPTMERAVAQVGVTALVVTGGDGTIRTWSRGAERLGAIGANRAVGKRIFDEVLRSPGLSWETLSARLAAKGRHQARVVLERANGTKTSADLDVLALKDAQGAFHTVLFAMNDRSEVQALGEEALATKTRALEGVFVDGVVRRLADACGYFEPDHRFVLARLQDLRGLARLATGGASARDLDGFVRRAHLAELDREMDDTMLRLGEGVHRLRTLVEDIGRFEATEVDPPGPVRIARELDAAQDLVGHHFENRVELEMVLEDLPPARASRAPLLRGLCLLLLASAASCENADAPKVTVEGRHQGGWLYLDVRDNGAGYSVDVQSRLSDFAFLASLPGYAALYLGMAREALRGAGGNLEIGTAAGVGAHVRVSFPAADAAAAVQPVELPRYEGAQRGRVLIVEEDELLRRAMERHVGEVHEVDSHATIADALGRVGDGLAYDAAVLAFPRPETFGLRLLGRFAETAPELMRNTIVVAPPGLKHATREKLVAQGCIVLTRPVDFTTLRSVLLRLMPPEEIVVTEVE